MTDKDQLGTRMKSYENVSRIYLPPRMPLIVRIDGKSFHSFTKGFQKPIDSRIRNAFIEVGKAFFREASGVKLVYSQSDEMSILFNDYEKFQTQAWFGKNLQKIASVSASIATAFFNKHINSDKIALFDARAFILPKEEVCNYFLWRMLDAERNSVSCIAQSCFSHKALLGKNTGTKKKMLLEKGINWDNLPGDQKRGFCVLSPNEVNLEFPRFNEDKEYVNRFLAQEEE